MSRRRPQMRLQHTERIEGPTFFTVENRWYQTEDGAEHQRSVVLHQGAVAVVPFDGERVWFVRQERVAVGREVLEIPAGKRDVPGEPPVHTARRECIEEIGKDPARLTLVSRFYNSPGFTDEYTHVFIGDDLRIVERAPVGAEEVHAEIVGFDLDSVRGMIDRDEVEDAKTLIGLQALLRREEGRG